jgi:hypothetical protein
MKKYLFLIFFTAFLTSGCKNIAYWIAGVKQPKIENKQSIQKFLLKIHQDTTDTYAIDSNLYNILSKQAFKNGWKPSFRPIQIRAYNSEGIPIMQWSSCEGFLKDLKTFDSVPPKNRNGLDTSLNLQEDLIRYVTLDGKPANVQAQKGYDYYFVIYFAKYIYKMSKESFRQVDKYKKKHPELKIKTYKVNVDFNEFWGVELNAPAEIGKKKKDKGS